MNRDGGVSGSCSCSRFPCARAQHWLGMLGRAPAPGYVPLLPLLFYTFWGVARTPRYCLGTESQAEAGRLRESLAERAALPRVGLAARPVSARVGKRLGAGPCDKAFCRAIYTREMSCCWQRRWARHRTLRTSGAELAVPPGPCWERNSPHRAAVSVGVCIWSRWGKG